MSKDLSLERVAVLPITVIKFFINNRNLTPRVEGIEFKVNSSRVYLFLKNSKCVFCGLQGTHFAVERHLKKVPFNKQIVSVPDKDAGFHVNLYGIDKQGNEVLFTKDHIVAKANGGGDRLSNYQTMCTRCNQKKGALSMEDFAKTKTTIKRIGVFEV